MTLSEARETAIKDSKIGAVRFVVFVPDQGQDVFNKAQIATYAGLVVIEETYFNGYLIAA